MSELQYNLQFEKLSRFMQLGEITGEPEAIRGGLLHRMYAVETTSGKYAIKALNPQIMVRPAAMRNYINSEQIANIADKHIPALPAKIMNGTSVQNIDNQFYLVFDWIDGKSLKPREINVVHCEKIGTVLAEIHRTDFSEVDIINETPGQAKLTDWNDYLKKGKESNSEWVSLLNEIIDKLYDWSGEANKSAELLASEKVISHGDLDPKNVMWHQDSPVIIDWESAGFINPMHDLIETAIYWSENGTGSMDKERLLAFIDGYKKRYGALQADWRMVLTNGFLGKLGWLEYSLRRSLWIECTDEEEQQMGTAQVTGTINVIRRYADVIPELEKWLIHEI